jgi:hypothetical protein
MIKSLFKEYTINVFKKHIQARNIKLFSSGIKAFWGIDDRRMSLYVELTDAILHGLFTVRSLIRTFSKSSLSQRGIPLWTPPVILYLAKLPLRPTTPP